MQQSMSSFEETYVLISVVHRSAEKTIWRVRNRWSGDECVVKMQAKDQPGVSVLHEGKFIQATQGYKGIPFLHWVGRDENNGRLLLIVDRLGDTLADLQSAVGGFFSLKTVCLLGLYLLDILRMYHGKNFAHGHLTPSVVQTGRGKMAHELYLNDLIDSHSFIRKDTLTHVEQLRTQKWHRVNMFMGAHRMESSSFSRRDDIHSIILIMVYARRGTLPWGSYFDRKASFRLKESFLNQGRRRQTHEEHALLEKLKEAMSRKSQVVCEGLPFEFVEMLDSVRNMSFTEEPNYNHYTMMIDRVMKRQGYEKDHLFDWVRNRKIIQDKLKINKELYEGDKNLCKFDLEQIVLEQCYLPYAESIQLD